MLNLPEVRVTVNPKLDADELFEFYERNNICEVGFGKERASRILSHPHVMVAAHAGDELVGLARATFDGLSAAVMEVSLDLRWQGKSMHENGSLVELDPTGLGAKLGHALLDELRRLGSTFVSYDVVEGVEEQFFESIGFVRKNRHLPYYIDERPYVQNGGGGDAG